jgi:hypothetical protein
VLRGSRLRDSWNDFVWKGCDEVQGFLYSKARPAHEVASMLRALATVLAGRGPVVQDRLKAFFNGA